MHNYAPVVSLHFRIAQGEYFFFIYVAKITVKWLKNVLCKGVMFSLLEIFNDY